MQSTIEYKDLLSLNKIDELYNLVPVFSIGNFFSRTKNFKKRQILFNQCKKDLKFHTIELDFKRDILENIKNINVLKKAYSDEEILKMSLSFTYTSPEIFDNYIESNPSIWLATKIKMSMWHSCYSPIRWNFLVDCFERMKTFKIDLPDFEVDIDTSSYIINEKGYSRNLRVFLDAELAFIIKYKGKHVFTISFNLYELDSKPTFHLCQLQCKETKGNRWLYKLPEKYNIFFTKKLMEHFSDFEFKIKSPSEIITDIRSNYLKNFNYYKDRLQENPTNKVYQEYFDECSSKLNKFDSIDVPRIEHIYNIKY
jgi:hypothetical protein